MYSDIYMMTYADKLSVLTNFTTPYSTETWFFKWKKEKIWVILEDKQGKHRHHLQSVVGGEEITGSV